MSKLGIIAAKGGLTHKLVEYMAAKEGAFIVAIEGEADQETVAKLEHIWIKVGEIGKAVEAMKAAKVERIVFVGSLRKPDILSVKVDWLGTKLLAKLVKNRIFGDNKLLSTATKFLEEQGFIVVGVDSILPNLTVDAGIFTILHPNDQDNIDIELGRKAVQLLGSLDIGQAAIVENGAVLGVEGMEGTDRLIERCACLKHHQDLSGVLVKFAKPGQELRADLPTIGIETIKSLHQAGFKGIMIEAKKSIFLDQIEAISYANEHKIFIGAL